MKEITLKIMLLMPAIVVALVRANARGSEIASNPSGTSGSVSIPIDSGVLKGYFQLGVTIETDSVIDLSDITVFGTSGEWLYQTPSDSVLDEIRGDRWTRYGINSGNPVIVHREDAFERSEITIRDGKTEGSPSQTAFTALSRRDMAFVYSDSGYMTRRRFITPVLVLTDGDTVRDCPCEELSLIFDRSSAGGEQVGTVTERFRTIKANGSSHLLLTEFHHIRQDLKSTVIMGKAPHPRWVC